MSQYAIGDDPMYPEVPDRWRCFLRRDHRYWYERAFEEAVTRLGYHERRHTLQTSKRDELPRSFLEEFDHLKGEVSYAIMLQALGSNISPDDLYWGEASAKARERSRQGNVCPGISVYVPHERGEGLIVRGKEAKEYPDLLYVLIWVGRPGTIKEYLQAVGRLETRKAWVRGSNFGPRGTRLRHPDDRLIPATRLEPMP